MKKTANGNMYTVALDSTWDGFEQNLEGAHAGIFLVTYTEPPSETVLQALRATAKSLGYGEPGATFASLRIEPAAQITEELKAVGGLTTVSPESTYETVSEVEMTSQESDIKYGNEITQRETQASGQLLLDPVAIFSLIEGLDPLVVVALDAGAAHLLSATYKQDIILERAGQLFGRPLVAFADFASHLENPDAKQRAWRLLKTLPKYCGK